jgi:hypothetical protein
MLATCFQVLFPIKSHGGGVAFTRVYLRGRSLAMFAIFDGAQTQRAKAVRPDFGPRRGGGIASSMPNQKPKKEYTSWNPELVRRIFG